MTATAPHMSMTKLVLLLGGIMMIPILAFGLFFAWTMRSGGDLAQLPVWASLADMDLTDRGAPSGAPELKRQPDGNLMFLGIPGVGAPVGDTSMPPAPTRAWLVLNEHAPDGAVKQRGTFRRYNLSCDYVEHLRRAVPDIDDYAVARLEQMCRSGRHA